MRLYDRAHDPADGPIAPSVPSAGHATSDAARKLPRRRTLVLAGLAVAGLAAAAFLALRAGPAGPRSGAVVAAAPAMAITVAAVRSENWDNIVEAQGTIEPWQEAVIGARNAGLSLAEVKADVGDSVKRGQLLARFDSALLLADLSQLEATLLQAQAAARQAEANRKRMLSLESSGGVSQQELLQYATQADTAAAQVAVVQAQIAAKRLQRAYADVRAPDDGVISSRAATQGAVAASGQELFRLIRQGRLEWRGEFAAASLPSLAPGQLVALRLPDGGSARARLRSSAPRLDPRSRLATVYADIEEGSRARAGMYVAGRVVLGKSAALLVPAASVVVRDGGSHVYTVAPSPQPAPGGARGPARVRTLPVTTGRRRGGDVEVAGKLAQGTVVAVQGAAFLNDGDSVRIAQSEPQSEPQSAPKSEASVGPKSGTQSGPADPASRLQAKEGER